MVGSAIRMAMSKIRHIAFKFNAVHTSKEEIITGLKALGILNGDIIFVHSSLRSLGFVEGGPGTVLAALRQVVGSKGTLIFPTYYQPGGTIYTTCKITGYIFDPTIHGTSLGALPSAFLKLPNVERSLHPTHSVSAIGPKAHYITEAHHTATSTFGIGSPWERFLKLDGKLLGLGVNMGPITFYHLLEDILGKTFPLSVHLKEIYELPCRARNGEVIKVSVVPFDPNYTSWRIDDPSREDLRNYFWNEFERAGILTIGRVGQAKSWISSARLFYEHLRSLMYKGITIYSTSDEIAKRPIA